MPLTLGLILGVSSGSGAPSGYVLPVPTLLEGYEVLPTTTQGIGAADTVNKVQGTQSYNLKGLGVSAQTPQGSKTTASMDPSLFGTIAVWFRQKKEGARNNSARYQIGRSAANFSDVANASVSHTPMSYWIANHVSEFATLTGLGVGTFDIKPRMFQNAPNDMDVDVDCVMVRANGRPQILFTFDDSHDTSLTIAEPLMTPYGIKGTCYLPITGAVGVGAANHLSIANCQTLYAAGWDMACDSTDDNPFTALADPAAAVADMQSVQAFLVTNSMPRAKDHLDYPNTTAWVVPTATQITAVTSDGTTTVTFGASTTFVTGQSLEGYNIPDGTTFTTSGTATSAVMSQPVPIQAARNGRMIDKTTAFYPGKLQDAFIAAGIKTMRGGGGSQLSAGGSDWFTRFGLAEQYKNMPSLSVGNATFAATQAAIDLAILRGTTLILLFHRINGGSGFDTSTAIFTQIVDYVGAKKRANILDTMTITEFYAKDGLAPEVLPF